MKHKIRNIPLFLTGAVLICLVITANVRGLAIGAAAVTALFIALQFCRPQSIRQIFRNAGGPEKILAFVIWLVLAVAFVYKWQLSSKIAAAAALVHLSGVGLLTVLAVCSIVSYPFFLFVIGLIPAGQTGEGRPVQKEAARKAFSGAGTAVFLLIAAVGIITLCSKSSPLYPLNDWVDSNCFFTVGKSMLNGKVLYRDIYEQKGPLLYMIHALAYIISHTTFTGVWLIEIAACFGFLWFSCRSLRLYCSDNVLILLPVLAMLIYTQTSFAHGDSAEELCLPLLAYGMYVGLKAVQSGGTPSLKECLVIGLTSGCVFWIKFTLVGFYIGWFILPAAVLIAGRNWKRLIHTILAIAGGVIAVSIPIFLYFAVNGAVMDLMEGYFFNNIFVYGDSSASSPFAWLRALLGGAHSTVAYSFAATIFIVLGVLWAMKQKDRKQTANIILMLAGTFVLVFIATKIRYQYYSFIMAVFAPLGLIPISLLLENKLPDRTAVYRSASAGALLVCIIASGILTPNRYLMFASKDEMPQYQFSEIISTVEDATLLNYGFLDGGFYTVSGIVPNCKYFCKINMDLDVMMETQDAYVEQGLVDFVVTRSSELDADNYECVAECTYYFEGTDYTYYLYELKSLLQEN